MKLLRTARDLPGTSGKVCLAMGFFDGVHLGHQQVLRGTLADARQHEATALVITFDQHPSTIVAPDRVPPLLYSLPKKLRVLESFGLDALLLLHFDLQFSRKTAEEFIRELHSSLPHLRSVSVGANFTFGYRRGGNLAVLQKLGSELQFKVHGLSALCLEGKPISSTRIRQAVSSGALGVAGQMLGRPYSLGGRVVRGDGLGRQLGFPTANVDVSGLVLPPKGVYAVRANVQGREHRAVLNIGYRPTLQNPAPELRVEAHLIDFNGDLYEEELELVFVNKLRDEQRFSSLEELKAQIALDIEAARLRF